MPQPAGRRRRRPSTAARPYAKTRGHHTVSSPGLSCVLGLPCRGGADGRESIPAASGSPRRRQDGRFARARNAGNGLRRGLHREICPPAAPPPEQLYGVPGFLLSGPGGANVFSPGRRVASPGLRDLYGTSPGGATVGRPNARSPLPGLWRGGGHVPRACFASPWAKNARPAGARPGPRTCRHCGSASPTASNYRTPSRKRWHDSRR